MTKLDFAKALILSTALTSISATAYAQSPQSADVIDEIIVTGTNIRGARINEALPVTVVTAEDLLSIGSLDGEDLIRALPANGAVQFNNSNAGTVNSARGDIASINCALSAQAVRSCCLMVAVWSITLVHRLNFRHLSPPSTLMLCLSAA